jgi:putative glycerol-1-phosphate prenyltransferase
VVHQVNLYQQIVSGKNQLAVLIDPGKVSDIQLEAIIRNATICKADYFFVGGSLVSDSLESTISAIRRLSKIPIILFPGSVLQISTMADGILFLSLISGRNPELLIGNHVTAASMLRKSELEIIPTGYILIGNGSITSVEYMSNTRPIPSNKPEIAVATALAGEMLGLKLIYLEAGSGADCKLQQQVVSEVKKNITVPLIIGGGIRNRKDLLEVYKSGADVAVVGTAAECDPGILLDFADRELKA